MKIELRGIKKKFGGVHAINDISLTFDKKQIIGILGENGAGKSTLMKILSGFLSADEGEIWINSNQASIDNPKSALLNGIGMLQQSPIDVGAFTVLENFMYGTQTSFLLNRRKAEKQLHGLMHRLGFKLDTNTFIESLSIAQRQQLEIIRLLALNVHTLILDEPTTGISTEQKEILFNALRILAHDEKRLVLIILHNLEDAVSLCNKIHVLRAGSVVDSRVMPESSSKLAKLMFGDKVQLRTRTPVDHNHRKVILHLENIKIGARGVVIENLSLKVRANEVVGFAGLEGSGIEVIIRALVGLQNIRHGRIYVGEKDMTRKSYHAFSREGVSFCPTSRTEEGLISELTLAEHMALVKNNGAYINWQKIHYETRIQIERFNIRGHSGNRIEELSGGNQQRVMLALLPENCFALVLENPTRGLDVESARRIWKRLLARCDTGACIVFTSPDLNELVSYSDRVIAFYGGHAVEVPNVNFAKIDEIGQLINGNSK